MCTHYLKEELPSKVQQDIISDRLEVDQICDALDVVNILLGFLSSGGGKANSKLEEYLKKLRMEAKPIGIVVRSF